MNATLLSCPFCGSNQVTVAPDYFHDDMTWCVMCKACAANVARDLEPAAITAWNTRFAAPAEVDARVEALRHTIAGIINHRFDRDECEPDYPYHLANCYGAADEIIRALSAHPTGGQ